jgi:serine/threonine protein kinase
MTLSVAEMAQMSFLLDRAIPLDAAARRRWIEQLSPKYRKLAAALRRSLLPPTAAESTAMGLDTLPKLDIASCDESMRVGDLEAGARVGPYELARQLGAGGMAEVWLARRADGAFTRQVALKVPTLSRRRPDLLQRFALERDILASLEHVNIVRMYDAGVTSDGRPYLAMEYVCGAPLIDWCDSRHVTLPDRIRLFLQVLDAVEYVHEHHVIHRDLKPSNILVTQDGQVRLLDFGVASVLSGPDQADTQLTSRYGRALTPGYASPELLRGESADVINDVYSLGVVLYELLTGDRPYRTGTGVSVTELRWMIATARIEAPSMRVALKAAPARATTKRRLARLLCGDLDAIVLKALSIAPEQRYASVGALADDLRRHLSDRPVQARSDQRTVRAAKFLLRHRSSILATLACLAAGALALIQPWMPPGSVAGSGRTSSDDRSIAVLPFVDMSENKDLEYFGDGIAEQLRSLLSNEPHLRVLARTSSFYFKDRPSAISEISRTLGVAFILEGSVRSSGRHLRVSVQLIRAGSGFQEWSQAYDCDADDVFRAQDEIANAVARTVKATLLPVAGPEFANARAASGRIVSAAGFSPPAGSADAVWERPTS